MRMLFYGGCHADILRDLFRICTAGTGHRFESIKNFELITAGKPVPYDEISKFDVVIYSPIVREGEYNTNELAAFLDAHKIGRLSYPWLEWRGYFTGVLKKNNSGWYYPWLIGIANSFGDFDDFVRYVDNMDREDSAIAGRVEQEFAQTSQILGWQEEANATDIRVLRFIEENHKTRRLFLTPDHPALALYAFVMKEIVRHTGLDADLSRLPSIEPQAGLVTPVLPFVRRSLGLAFCGDEFEDRRFTNSDRAVPLREYLKIPFHVSKGWVALEAVAPTFLKAREANAADLPDAEKIGVAAGTVVLFRELERRGHHARASAAFLAGHPALAPSFIYPPAWKDFIWPAGTEALRRNPA